MAQLIKLPDSADDPFPTKPVSDPNRRGRGRSTGKITRKSQAAEVKPNVTFTTEDIDDELDKLKTHRYSGEIFDVDFTGNPTVDLRWMSEQKNLAVFMHESARSYYGAELIRQFELDLSSRQEWEKGARKGLDLAQQAEDHGYTTPIATDEDDIGDQKPPRVPLITTAVIELVATVVPILLSDPLVVKVTTPPSNGAGPAAGVKEMTDDDRLSSFMSWQVVSEDANWSYDTDRLIGHTAAIGTGFRKRVFDPVTGLAKSSFISGLDIVVNNKAPNLERAPRITEIMCVYPNEVRRNIASGLWCGIDSMDTDTDWHKEVEFIEMQTWLDFDDDGQDEPYIVTIYRETEAIVRVQAAWSPHEFTVGPEGVIDFQRFQYLTPYFLVPAMDGTFYAKGFGHLIGRLNTTADDLVNEIVEAARLSNANGGVLGRVGTGMPETIDLKRNELQVIPTEGSDLAQNLIMFPTKEPSQVLFTTLGLLVEQSKALTSTVDLMSEGTPANMPATTAMAVVQQGSKLQSMIVKRLWGCMGNEFRQLYDLDRRHIKSGRTFAYAGKKGGVDPKDFADATRAVVCSADPTLASDLHRSMMAQFLHGFIGDPLTDQVELRRRIWTLMRVPALDALLAKQPPPPDPKTQAVQMKFQIDQQKLELQKMELVSIHLEREAKNTRMQSDALKLVTEAILNMLQAEQVGAAVPEAEEKLRQAYAMLASLHPEGTDANALLQAAAQPPAGGPGNPPSAGDAGGGPPGGLPGGSLGGSPPGGSGGPMAAIESPISGGPGAGPNGGVPPGPPDIGAPNAPIPATRPPHGGSHPGGHRGMAGSPGLAPPPPASPRAPGGPPAGIAPAPVGGPDQPPGGPGPVPPPIGPRPLGQG